MQPNDKGPYIVIVIFALFVLAGFYMMFDKNNTLSTDVKNLELQLALKNQTPAQEAKEQDKSPIMPDHTSEATTTPTPAPTPELQAIIIPTAIIFDTPSSPLLQPQSTITVTVESVSKTDDGTITLAIKGFTKNATSYTAFEPGSLFELLIPEGENQKPLQVVGQFNSIPPKSVSAGKIVFKIDPSLTTPILQVGSGDATTYYELNFTKKTYKETEVG